MSGYFARIWSAVAGFAVLCGVLLTGGIRELSTNPAQGVVEIVTVPIAIVVTIVGVFCVGWVRNETSRNRKSALVARSELRWLGDVQIDSASLARLVARSSAGVVEQPPQSSYAFTVSATAFELWGDADTTSPVVTLPLDCIAGGSRLPGADTARGSGEFELQVQHPSEAFELALTGGFMGVYAPTPRSFDRFIASILDARVAKLPLDPA